MRVIAGRWWIAVHAAACGLLGRAEECAQHPIPGQGMRKLNFTVGGHQRQALLYVPRGCDLTEPNPLILLGPGTAEKPNRTLAISEMHIFAEEKGFVLLVIIGLGDLLNVAKEGLALGFRPDDVAYTKEAVRQANRHICIDKDRIYCTGYSRGARFCSRLASEAPRLVAAIAPVAGVIFPAPNNASRPVPVIAFHGTQDDLNPYDGGGPPYWQAAVKDSVQKWADFNGCRKNRLEQLTPHVMIRKHSHCTNHSDVTLITVMKGGHTWPGTNHVAPARWRDLFGFTTHEVKANELMWRFFMDHPLHRSTRHARDDHPLHQLQSATHERHRKADIATSARSTAAPLAWWQSLIQGNPWLVRLAAKYSSHPRTIDPPLSRTSDSAFLLAACGTVASLGFAITLVLSRRNYEPVRLLSTEAEGCTDLQSLLENGSTDARSARASFTDL